MPSIPAKNGEYISDEKQKYTLYQKRKRIAIKASFLKIPAFSMA
jgi:hypothetical protein